MSNRIQTNPWAGLSSYQDPETAEVQLKFCGRDNESFDVAQLIDDNIFVTLYGKSGTGKTSLLNAGVFPRLRQEQYLPVSIRLGMDAMNISFQQCLLAKLAQALQDKGTQTSVDVVPLPSDDQATEYLWSYFARTQFVANDGSILFPVLVFDQFEEAFRNRRSDVETLLRQIYFMMDENHALSDRMVGDQFYQYNFNFRFVVSIREDDLYRLEDSIDNCYLPELKRCRYRLHSLSEQGAKDAILIPGEGLFLKEDQNQIVHNILEIARNKEDQSVSTNLLSLVCSRIYVDYQKSDVDFIGLGLVESFVKGNPFERFYNEATRKFSTREKSYIENHLVDTTGRRNSISESNFFLHVPKGKLLLEGDTRILQRVCTSSDNNNYRIELIHDSFCEPLVRLSQYRRQKQKFTKILSVAGIFIILTCISFYFYNLLISYNNLEKWLVNIRSEQILLALDEGDSYLARTLAIRSLPKDLQDPDIPYQPKAELALRKASMHETAFLRGHKGQINSVAFSPDGKYIATCSHDSSAIIWDAMTGEKLRLLKGHQDHVLRLSFNSKGNLLATVGGDSTARIWDVKSGQEKIQFKAQEPMIYSVSFHPNGRLIAMADGNLVRIYSLLSNKEILRLEGHKHEVYYAVYSHDGTKIASASLDGTVKIWDAKKGSLIQTMSHGENREVTKVLFSLNDKYVYSATWNEDNELKIWEIETGKELRSIKVGESPDFYLSPDGKSIACTFFNGTIKIFDVNSGIETQRLTGGRCLNALSYSPDGKRIVTGSIDGTARLWEFKEGDEKCTLHQFGYLGNSVRFAPKGKDVIIPLSNGDICIWNIEKGQETMVLKGHEGNALYAEYSDDGQRIVSTSRDSTIRAWETKTGKNLLICKDHGCPTQYASYSHNRKHIVSSDVLGTIIIRDAETGQIERRYRGHQERVYSVVYSPDDNFILSSSLDGFIKIWDAFSGDLVRSINTGNGISYTDFSPDGRFFVSASNDNVIRLWDAQTGKLLHSMYGHEATPFFASFSPNGERILTTSWDGTIRVWDVKAGAQVAEYNEATTYPGIAVFSPDGRSIVSVSGDNTLKVWEYLPLQELIDKTRERFKNRQLTKEESQKYYLD